MHAFRQLCNAYEVQYLRACATSAMRDAANAASIIEQVKMETGITIEVISGETEANLIYENHLEEQLSGSDAFLYIDVGGGSTELSFFSRRQLQFKKSFNIGTIRLLKQQVSDQLWQEMQDYLTLNTRIYPNVYAIGSGGNINKLFSLARIKEGQPLPLTLIVTYYQQMGKLSVEERMHRYKLKADRADVIVPALLIYLNVMQWSRADEIFVPRIGLVDGLIQHLYKQISHNHI